MKRELAYILACPIDKADLQLYIFEESEEIVTGIFVCAKCGRWFPIREEIPELLPDILRDEDEDKEFYDRWSHLFPEELKDGY